MGSRPPAAAPPTSLDYVSGIIPCRDRLIYLLLSAERCVAWAAVWFRHRFVTGDSARLAPMGWLMPDEIENLKIVPDELVQAECFVDNGMFSSPD